MRWSLLLVILVLLWAGALAAAAWLGLMALAAPRIVDAPPRLVLRAEAPGAATAEDLREALRAAGMRADGAVWRLEDPVGPEDGAQTPRHAIEMRAEDTRSLARLPSELRMTRLGGEAAIVLAVPDRGSATQHLVLPVVRSRIAAHARAIGAEVVARRQRSGEGRLELQWVLARHPRGRAAPEVRPPRLEAPQLPSGRGAARGGP